MFPGAEQAERWGWTPAVRRVREQYRRAIRVHRAQQRRFWRQKWIARIVWVWRATVGLFAQVSSSEARVVACLCCRGVISAGTPGFMQWLRLHKCILQTRTVQRWSFKLVLLEAAR